MPELGTDIQRILITGGAGFIGSALIKELQRYDLELLVVDDLSFGNRAFIDIPDSHFKQFDILDADRLNQTAAAFDPHWIIHLAAVTSSLGATATPTAPPTSTSTAPSACSTPPRAAPHYKASSSPPPPPFTPSTTAPSPKRIPPAPSTSTASASSPANASSKASTSKPASLP